MKAKNMILLDIKNILMDRKDYSSDKADAWIEENKGKTVYELLVLKKTLSKVEEEYRDVSCRTSIWHEEEY
jgi:predicted mannosyl-3-phosphoglycerate phosphatase (HAD superfamily)